MSKVLGIISEYNPFHNGHKYHIEKSIERTAPDYTVCIMSGNFIQRGDTSILDKWSKAEIALKCGVDLVIELPTIYAISSAENFSEGSIKILSSLSKDVTISFGSETGDLEVLNKFAQILYENPPEYLSLLNHELARGISYPKARENALLMYINDIRKCANVLSGSNNILAIEYLKAIKKLNSKVTTMTVKRKNVEYNSVKAVDGFASATAIRKYIQEEQDIKPFLPEESYKIVSDRIKYGKIVSSLFVFEKEILYTLRKMTVEEIGSIADVTEGLENRIKESSNTCNSIEDLINMIKSKRYTRTRVQRILLYILLGITKEDIDIAYKSKPYIRVLATNEKGKELLSEISKKNKSFPVITSVKKFIDTNKNRLLKRMLEIDILASDIYTLGHDYESKANLDYTEKLIVL
jgi:predicted nucleotidyltransferase